MSSTDYPVFMPDSGKLEHEQMGFPGDMKTFLKRRIPYTLVPTPLPADKTSALNEFYFTDSRTQDLLAIISACLHKLYDVPRAKQVFEQLRSQSAGRARLVPQLYNQFLESYLNKAASGSRGESNMWIHETWSLYNSMENGAENVQPTAGTYAVMLLAWLRWAILLIRTCDFLFFSSFNPESDPPVDLPSMSKPANLLMSIVDRRIPVSHVVSDRVFTSSKDAASVIKILSKAAVDLSLSHIVGELGQADAIGREYADPLADVPEVLPVFRIKVSLSFHQVTMNLSVWSCI
jgi:DNA-directed RNA polymerase, mitochondrial